MFYSCAKQDFTSCEGYYKEEVVDGVGGKLYSNILLNDTNYYWLNYSTNDRNVSFENGVGFSIKYLEYGKFGYGRQDLYKYLSNEKRSCVGKVFYVDGVWLQYEYMVYKPLIDGEGNKFDVTRYIKIEWDTAVIKDTLVILSKKEGLEFFEEYKFRRTINTDSLFNSETQKFHNVIMLRNKSYESVFELINTNVNLPSIEIKGYYYSFKNGLIGYYLTNNELWLKK